jgi:histidinol-phosphatase
VPPEPAFVARALEAARRAAQAGGAAALPHWRNLASVETKADGTPVTAADRAAEAAILEVLRGAFPDHAVLSEESGASGGPSPSRWIVDPLDGTLGFSRGGRHWGPLVALEHEGRVLAGAMALPAMGESYWAARGHGCWRDGERCAVSEVAAWSGAILLVGSLRPLLGRREAGMLSLIRGARQTRCPGDLAGVADLVSGRAEAWLEAGVQAWDLAALKVMVEEAGGRFTDLQGGDDIERGEAVASNGRLHAHLLAALA